MQAVGEVRDRNRAYGNRVNDKFCTTLVSLRARDLLRSFGRSVRRNYRRAQRCGLKFSLGGEEFLDPFYRLYFQNSRQLGSPHFGRDYFTGIFKHFRGQSYIALASCAGTVVAADFMVRYKNTLHSLQAGADYAYFHCAPNYFIITESMLFGQRQCCTRYDFGRSVRGGGTHFFKQHWKGDDYPLYYSYKLWKRQELPDFNPHSELYDLPRRLWRELPESVAARVGPWLVKYLH